MPRVTRVKSARQDNPVCKKGESYFWWKFRYGGKRYSLTMPSRSQLTQSGFLSQLYDLQDSNPFAGHSDESDFESARDEMVSDIQEMADECQESRDNMPEQLQDAPTGELLGERVEALEEWISELENVDISIDVEDLDDDGLEERLTEIEDELSNCECSL
jgi:hypothetical protein